MARGSPVGTRPSLRGSHHEMALYNEMARYNETGGPCGARAGCLRDGPSGRGGAGLAQGGGAWPMAREQSDYGTGRPGHHWALGTNRRLHITRRGALRRPHGTGPAVGASAGSAPTAAHASA